VHKLFLTWFNNPCGVYTLESEPASNISQPTNLAKPQKHLKIVVIVAAIVAVVAGAFLASAFLLQPQGQNAWLFKGAYAKYEGSTTLFSVTVGFTVRQEVLDFNSTHAKISTYFKMSFGETVENETAAWVPLSEMGFTSAFDEANLTKSYESTVDISGFGTRTCVVYEYAISDEGLSMTVYVDKQIDWPLKITMSMAGEYPLSLDINLIDSNIPGLK
jgi:hypothetical protein